MTYEIVDCAPSHLKVLENTLRKRDCLEVLSLGLTVRKALWQSYRTSIIRRVILVDGEVAAAWGCAGPTLGGVGTPWLLTAPAIERIPVSFVKLARQEIAKMLTVFPRLENYIDAGYHGAVNLARLLGFHLYEPIPVGPNNVPFHRAVITRDPVVFSVEKFSDTIEEAKPLLERHWQEIARNRDIVPLDPDWDRYKVIEASGKITVFTVRRNGRLIGYADYIVDTGLHYKSTLFATSDIFWIAPEERKGRLGWRMFAFIEDDLRKRGVVVQHTMTKDAHPAAGRVLEAQGHTKIESGYAKRLVD